MLSHSLLQFAALTSIVASSALPEFLTHTAKSLAARQADHSVTIPTEYSVACGCGIVLDAADTNKVASVISSGGPTDLAPGGSATAYSGNVVAFICNVNDGTEAIAFDSSQFLPIVQNIVTPICGSFVAGTWRFRNTAGSSNVDIQLGYMLNNGQSTEQICQAAMSSPIWTNTDSDSYLPYIC